MRIEFEDDLDARPLLVVDVGFAADREHAHLGADGLDLHFLRRAAGLHRLRLGAHGR